METSTHTVFLGEIIKMDGYNDSNPMTYKYYHDVIKGTAPKTAPTYYEENKEEEKKMEEGKKFKCKICGHIYDENGK